MQEKPYHSLKLEALFSSLKASPKGLTSQEAQKRLAEWGRNEIIEVKKETPLDAFLRQFRSLPILMLLAAAAISLFLGIYYDSSKFIDSVAITAAVLIAVSFSFFQEYKAERALAALKKMVVARSVVLRNGRQLAINSSELVVGDIVIVEEGSRVPADLRLIEDSNLSAEQSALTGESVPSHKQEGALPEKTVLAARQNMLFAGTTVVRGHCKGVVVATGMNTEFGKIVGYVDSEGEKETRLQHDIAELSKTLGYAGIALAAVFFAIGLMRGESATSMFVVAVTLAVAVIPEGLPTVLAIILALGVQKMARKNAIVRKMPAVETLGSSTVICTDKTGTITQNKMTVQEVILAQSAYTVSSGELDPHFLRIDPALLRAVEVMALCNNAMVVESEGSRQLSGDPTETALLSAVASCGADQKKIRAAHKLDGEIPFDSQRKMMSTIRFYGNSRLALVKGAPEHVLPLCSKILSSLGETKLSEDKRKGFLSESHELGLQGMRVLALAYRPIEHLKKYTSQNTEKDLVFVGLVAMEDPPRPEVAQAISLCRSAGIKVVMITGDSLPTATAIAKKVGLLQEGMHTMDGSQLEGLSDSRLQEIVGKVAVFARVTPEQKYRIVAAFKERGEIVAVTGDGVNDAPAIRKADIGVAMGLTGTDFTKEVADIVLTDDNFSSIVNAIKYGRTIFNNIKSFVRYQISTNVAALSLMFAAPAMGLPLPLLPIQLLWINIMIDGPPALALGAESPSQDEMKRPPRSPKAPFLSTNIVLSILLLGLLMGAIALAVFGFYLSYAPEKAYTVVFTLFVFLQLFNALNCRSASESLFTRLFSNPYIYLAIAVSLLLHLSIVYYAPLEQIFKTVPLDQADFTIITVSALLIVLFEETKKKFLPRTTVY